MQEGQQQWRRRRGGAAKGFGFGTKKDPKVDKYKYSGRLRPGQLSTSRLVPADIMRPDYALDGCVGAWLGDT